MDVVSAVVAKQSDSPCFYLLGDTAGISAVAITASMLDLGA